MPPQCFSFQRILDLGIGTKKLYNLSSLDDCWLNPTFLSSQGPNFQFIVESPTSAHSHIYTVGTSAGTTAESATCCMSLTFVLIELCSAKPGGSLLLLMYSVKKISWLSSLGFVRNSPNSPGNLTCHSSTIPKAVYCLIYSCGAIRITPSDSGWFTGQKNTLPLETRGAFLSFFQVCPRAASRLLDNE